MRLLSVFLLSCSLNHTLTLAHEGHEDKKQHQAHSDASQEMRNAANSFLKSLNEEQKKKASFTFKNEERENWHFVPLDDRKGIRLGTLKPHQKHLAYGLLGTGLTQKGLLTATQIMTLEQVLADAGGDPELRNTEKYFISIFGNPSSTDDKPWGWRFEGHHLSLNFTLAADKVLGAPAFFGTNPAELKQGPLKGMRPLGEVEDTARTFAKSLIQADANLSPVFTDKPPRDILTSQERVAKALEKAGINSAKLSDAQFQQLINIIEKVASLKRPELTKTTLKNLRTDKKLRQNLHFAWGGSLERHQAHYFRIQSPDFLIEYANTQNNANHAHLVWRNLKNDFARDLLQEHYKTH